MTFRQICRVINYEVDEFVEWKLPAADLLSNCSLNCINSAGCALMFPEAVLEFWGGLRFSPETGFLGQALDHPLTLDIPKLSRILKARPTGAEYSYVWKLDYPTSDINNTLYGSVSICPEDVNQYVCLTPAAKLIHTLSVNVFCPRKVKHSYVRDKDMFIIYHTLNGLAVDPVHLVYQHMQSVLRNTSYAIPYGFLVTHLMHEMTEIPYQSWTLLDVQDTDDITKNWLQDRGIDFHQPEGTEAEGVQAAGVDSEDDDDTAEDAGSESDDGNEEAEDAEAESVEAAGSESVDGNEKTDDGGGAGYEAEAKSDDVEQKSNSRKRMRSASDSPVGPC